MNSKKRLLRLDTLAFFLFSTCFFYFLLLRTGFEYYPITDIKLHAITILKVNYGLVSYPVNFIYYFIVNIISLFSKDLYMIYLASCIVLGVSYTLKYEVTKFIIGKFIKTDAMSFNAKKMIITVSLLLMFVFAIQDYFGYFMFDRDYYGKIVPNVWVNSTTIFLFPFSLLLFWVQFKAFEDDKKITRHLLLILSLLVILNILIKPSFYFAYLPATLYLLFKRYGLSNKIIRVSAPVVLGLPVIYFMHKLIFIEKIGDFNDTAGSVILSKPFEVWTYFVPGWYLPISFAFSLAFPIIFMIFYYKKANNSFLTKYSVFLFTFAFLISVFLAEKGSRMYHGNFMWQNVICSYLLFLSTTIESLKIIISNGFRSLKIKILTLIFLLHAFSGIFYVIRIFVLKRIS